MNTNTKFLNSGRLEIEGSFDLSAAAAVSTISQPDGSTKTCRGENMTCAKNTTGTYDVTVKLASSLDGQPVFQPVELLNASASIVAATVAVALSARVSAVAKDSNGNLKITVITAQTSGAAADTTAAITVCFSVAIGTQRMGMPL